MSQPITWKKSFKWNQKGITWNGLVPDIRKNMARHVSLGFCQLTDQNLLPFTANVVVGLTGNAACPTPPVLATALDGHRQIFEDALGKAFKGSVADTAAKDTARAVVIDDLRQDAAYVELKAGGVASVITGTGYLTVSHDHSPVAIMPKAVIKKILNSATGQLLVRAQAIANVHSFEVESQVLPGAWQPAGTFTQARSMLLKNLTPGTSYNIRIRAVGGNNTYGEWSDLVAHMCT